MTPQDREQLKVKLVSAVLANVTPNGDKLNVNVSVAMEMVDKVLVDFEVLKIRRKM